MDNVKKVVYLMCTSDELWEAHDRCHQIKFICNVYGLHFCRTYDYVFKARKGFIAVNCLNDISGETLQQLLNGVTVTLQQNGNDGRL